MGRERDRPIGRAQYSRRALARRSRSCEPVVSANTLVGVICLVLGSYREGWNIRAFTNFPGYLSAACECGDGIDRKSVV